MIEYFMYPQNEYKNNFINDIHQNVSMDISNTDISNTDISDTDISNIDNANSDYTINDNENQKSMGPHNEFSIFFSLPFFVSIFFIFIFFLRFIFYFYMLINSGQQQTIEELTSNIIVMNDMELCSICLEPFQNNERIVNLQCNHSYHTTCINNWMRTKPTCPICRLSISV